MTAVTFDINRTFDRVTDAAVTEEQCGIIFLGGNESFGRSVGAEALGNEDTSERRESGEEAGDLLEQIMIGPMLDLRYGCFLILYLGFGG